MRAAFLTQLLFELIPTAFATNAIATDAYTTPEDLRADIGSIARLSYLNGVFSGSIVLSGADTVVGTVRLTDGINDLCSVPFSITAGTSTTFREEGVNFKCATGGTPVYVAVDITTAGAAATAQIYASALVEFPLIIAE